MNLKLFEPKTPDHRSEPKPISELLAKLQAEGELDFLDVVRLPERKPRGKLSQRRIV